MNETKTILVVDDHDDDRMLLKELFESEGYHILLANNGETANEILDSEKIDLVFSDILMPVIDGIALCKIIKSSPKFKAIPVILYSSIYTDENDMTQALAAGADRYLVKPISPEVLLALIPEIIDSSISATVSDIVVEQASENDKEKQLRLYSTRLVNRLENEVEKLKEEINKREALEFDLLKAKKMAEITLSSIADGVITIDDEGFVISMNLMAENITGWKFSETKGISINSFFSVIDHTTNYKTPNLIEEVLSTRGVVFFEKYLTLLSKDGDRYQISGSASAILDENNKILGVVLVFNDITEQVDLREKSAKNEAQVRLLLDSAVEAIYGIDTEGNCTFVNQSCLKVLGYERDTDLLGFNIHELIHHKHVDGSHYPVDQCPVFQVVKYEKADHRVDEVFWKKNGSSFAVEYWSHPIFEDNTCVGAVVTFFDITIKKNADEMFRRSQKMEALGKLTGGIAHDYNNMLGVVTGYAELLESNLSDDPKLAKYAQQVQKAGQRGIVLTKKLLNFSREKSANEEVSDINSQLKNEQHMLEKILTASIQLDLDLDAKLWPVWIDNGDLEDTIINVCINAMHAINGNGQLFIRTRNEYLTKDDARMLNLNNAGEYVVLHIEDTGCGIDQPTKEKIFDPFYSTKGEEGTGLGLSQVYGFVQRSKGAVGVTSEIGKGTCFSFYFPRYVSSDINSQPAVDNIAIENETVKKLQASILVVDDEPALLSLTSEILGLQGYRVFGANNAKQALELLEMKKIDLMFSDVIMPEMDGYQLARYVKEKYPNVKIQLASGFDNNQNKHVLDDEFHKKLLHKPYNSKALLTKIRELLED